MPHCLSSPANVRLVKVAHNTYSCDFEADSSCLCMISYTFFLQIRLLVKNTRNTVTPASLQLHHHAFRLFHKQSVGPHDNRPSFLSFAISHHLSIITVGAKPCDSTQFSSLSCLFSILHTLVCRHFVVFHCVNIPVGVHWHATQFCLVVMYFVVYY